MPAPQPPQVQHPDQHKQQRQPWPWRVIQADGNAHGGQQATDQQHPGRQRAGRRQWRTIQPTLNEERDHSPTDHTHQRRHQPQCRQHTTPLQAIVMGLQPPQRHHLTPGEQADHQQNRVVIAFACRQQIAPQHPGQQRQKRQLKYQDQRRRHRHQPRQSCQQPHQHQPDQRPAV